jgi:hypothetical protein
MRALAAARAPTCQQRKERSQIKQQKGIKKENKDKTTEFTFESFRYL